MQRYPPLIMLGLLILAAPLDAAPDPPAGLTAYIEDTSIRLHWIPNTEPDSVSSYHILRDVTPNATTLHDSVAHPTTTYLDTRVANGQIYYYRLKPSMSTGSRAIFRRSRGRARPQSGALLSGDSSYVDLGVGTFDDLNDFTVEFWARLNSYQYWARFFGWQPFRPWLPGVVITQWEDSGVCYSHHRRTCAAHEVHDDNRCR
jgi:hypothetical protein